MKPAKAESPTVLPSDNPVPLESVLCTEELNRRPSRPPDYETENRALAALVQALADSPRSILQTLADTILEVFKADSAGISLLTKDRERFYWPAIAGVWKPHLGGGTPRDFGPCGDVLDRNAPLLFRHFERRYTYFMPVTPPVEECLLVPFYVEGKAVGTLWAIAHDKRRTFDAEDLRQLVSLGRFASLAYQAVASLDAALNLMEDAVQSSQSKEALNVKLRESEERYRTLFTAAPMAVFVCDLNAVIQQYNLRAVELWGREPACGVEQHCGSVKLWLPNGTLLPHAQSPIVDVLRTGIPARDVEVFIERPDGSRLPVLVNFAALKNAEGDITGAITSFMDITKRKQAEEALRERDRALMSANDALQKQKAALAESNKELEGFSYSVSHDLRAPLRTIDAFSRIVEEDHGPHLNAEAHRCLTIVRKAAAQAGELIDDLLEFSRLGRQGMDFRLVKMADLAREAADDLRIMQEGRKIDMLVADLPPCRGDRRLLKLVWTNLLANAFKYTKNRDAARIEVGWLPDDASAEAVTYYVKDDGVGFDMKYVHKLFGVFQRLHRKEDFDGTGVGLAIVHRIVHRHGGRVWAEGKVDGGATFFFSLRKARA